MKKFLVLLGVISIFSAMVLLTGCDSRDAALVGTWVFEDDSSWVTTFNEDGTGTHALDWGFGTSFRWSTGGSNINWNYSGHPSMRTPYTISGGVLSITMADGTVFRYIAAP